MQPCVYLLANRRNGTLYVGVTSDLGRRVSEHKADIIEGFTKRYGVHMLVHAEFHATMDEAISREKRIKTWRRAWKIALIEKFSQLGVICPTKSADDRRSLLDPRLRGGDEAAGSCVNNHERRELVTAFHKLKPASHVSQHALASALTRRM